MDQKRNKTFLFTLALRQRGTNPTQNMNTLFSLHKNVVFPGQAERSYFSTHFRLTIFLHHGLSCMTFPFQNVWGYPLQFVQVFFVVMVRFAVWRKDSKKFWTVKLKESSYLMFVIFTDFQHANLYPFQNLSHGFIVKYRILKI